MGFINGDGEKNRRRSFVGIVYAAVSGCGSLTNHEFQYFVKDKDNPDIKLFETGNDTPNGK